LNDFPVISETFILNQIVGLIRRGHELDIFARGRMELSSKEQHADVERYQLFDRTNYYTRPSSWPARLGSAAKRLAYWGWRQPKIALGSVNILHHGRSALSLALLHEVIPPLEAPQRYDVIHCHYGPNGQIAATWRNFGALRGPIITTFHGYDVNKLPRVQGPNLYQNLFNRGELFTVGSAFVKERIIALGAPEDRIVELPMGVNLSRFHFSARVKNNTDELRLLSVGRLVEVKGIEYAIRAVASLKDRYTQLRYQIVGDGPLRAELEKLADLLGMVHQVEFLGALSQEKLIPLYEHAHIFVAPSIATSSGEVESQSLALAEAQASGLPVIGTKIGGIPESMREGESGLLVAPRDPNALARAIEQLAENPHIWGQMGQIGRAHVEHYFDLEKLNDRLVDLYSLVASNNCQNLAKNC
jgi:colanic acid/amylovoran/stewartan biosynthesis glycosyltransferase WcaL/AmsK/CpsK